MRKILLVIIIVISYTIPFLSYGFTNQFLNQPIQQEPSFGLGERYVGNTQTQIIIPPPTTIEGQKSLSDKLPDDKLNMNPAFEVQESKPYTTK